MEHHRVCVIGAGPCGLVTIKNLRQAGIHDIVCHEAQDDIGGLWAYSGDPDRPSVHAGTHIITSRRISELPYFWMPQDYPDYPSHRQIKAYFDRFADAYGVREHIRFRSEVTQASRDSSGRWTIRTRSPKGEEIQTADYLLVCAGHHRIPDMPDLPGHFAGDVMHGGRYRTPGIFRGRRVLVVGAGNTACDIASAASDVAEHVSLSIRTPTWIIPKYLLGKPVDVQWRKARRIPSLIRGAVIDLAVSVSMGDHAHYRLRKPDYAVWRAHPTLSTQILDRLAHGMVQPRAGIDNAEGDRIVFSDGTSDIFDIIVFATGYRTAFPWLDLGQGPVSFDGDVRLFLNMVAPEAANLFHIGLVQPLGCIWVVADYQAQLVAQAINGTWSVPANIENRIDAEVAERRRRYLDTPRHRLQIDFFPYMDKLASELARAGVTVRL